MYVIGYVLVGGLAGLFVAFAFQGVKKAQRKIVALGLLAYGLFGLPYGGSVNSSLTMFIGAVTVVVGLEFYLREWKEDLASAEIVRRPGGPEAD